MPSEETKQTEKTAPTGYDLSPEERLLFATFNENAKAAKVDIHDLNAQLELAQKRRDEAIAQFGSALAAYATVKGLRAPVTISPDFTRIEGAK